MQVLILLYYSYLRYVMLNIKILAQANGANFKNNLFGYIFFYIFKSGLLRTWLI